MNLAIVLLSYCRRPGLTYPLRVFVILTHVNSGDFACRLTAPKKKRPSTVATLAALCALMLPGLVGGG
jgi:hypothetical protein